MKKILFIFIFFLSLHSVAYAEIINLAKNIIVRNDNSSFELIIPENFESFSKSLQPKDWLYGFKERTGFQDKAAITIGIELSDGSLDQGQNIDLYQWKRYFPQAISIQRIPLHVLGVEVYGLRIVISVDDLQSIMYIVQVPVTPVAIQITVGGLIEREKEIAQTLLRILSSVKAKDNWEVQMKTSAWLNWRLGLFIFLLFALVITVYLYKRTNILKR